jgi:hypothetical protein
VIQSAELLLLKRFFYRALAYKFVHGGGGGWAGLPSSSKYVLEVLLRM